MTLTFEPELIEGVEYTVSVASTTELNVTLLAGHAWRAEAGKLLVKSMIFDDLDGGFQIFPHARNDWTVAEVVADTEDGAFVEDELPIVFHPDEIDHAVKFDDATSDEECDDDDDIFDMDNIQWRAVRDRTVKRPSLHYHSSQRTRRALQSGDGAVNSDLAVLTTLLTARDLRPCLVVLSSIAVLLVLYRNKVVDKQNTVKGADHTHAATCLV